MDGDIEGGCGLVGDKKIGSVGERHGDHHALALAPRELMREGAETRDGIRNTDFLQKLDNASLDLFGASCAMQLQYFADLPRDRMQRIERGHWLLEDHGDLGASNLAQACLTAGQKILALEQHLALHLGGAAEQTHDRESGNGFAGAQLADKRHRGSAFQRKGNAVDGDSLGAALPEANLEITDVEERVIGR